VGHLGFVPRKSTWVGGVRAVGKSATEALELWDRFRRLEDAGAFEAEGELIAAPVMAEIHRRTSLVTISLGSGPAADVVFLFTSDICGESNRTPRHARRWGDLAAKHQAVRDERVQALTRFGRKWVQNPSPPAPNVRTLRPPRSKRSAPDWPARMGQDRSPRREGVSTQIRPSVARLLRFYSDVDGFS
jgi:3-methyl-2-oxobutanoate hydroxymethyltransferase